ncbi:hypothetical protein HX109_10860 [Galbibacter sp. BG1]|uniref:toxin-antitoxin system YwqK family antitoxin n=1 Tax=Galbibacter sp. BG1 TaxID=1170699 RepID=UPI0015C1A490|nr:hypothetical protein [Galbibacter sp. BG1]QLE02029.1 hypothetical protein HX109_10860 [Galbibacter sp. BG1]
MNYKKKHILCFLALFISIISIAQEIRFELFIRDNCNNTVQKVPSFNLRKNGIDFYPKNNDGVVILKEKGVYELSTIYSDEVNKCSIENFGVIKDTINMPIIKQCLEPTSNPRFVGYCCCNNECEGEKVDYYANGNKRLEGYFEKGKPIGKLKMYYSDGSLKQVDKYDKKGKLIRSKKYKLKSCKKSN